MLLGRADSKASLVLQYAKDRAGVGWSLSTEGKAMERGKEADAVIVFPIRRDLRCSMEILGSIMVEVEKTRRREICIATGAKYVPRRWYPFCSLPHPNLWLKRPLLPHRSRGLV